MQAYLLLLFAASALASHTYAPQTVVYHSEPFPVASLVFTIIFSVCALLNILWIIKISKSKPDFSSEDVEKQSLAYSTLPEGVVATNITVSEKSRPSLMGELRQDENLVWAHEAASPSRRSILGVLVFALCFVIAGLAISIVFLCLFDGKTDVVFINLWIPLLVFALLMYLIAGLAHKSSSSTVIYALTSKRVFIFSAVGAGCGSGKLETVRAYDLDGIHQTTLTRKDDGTGTLTFSAAAIADGAGTNSQYGLFAFTNIPNVTAVKDLIEQYKTLRRKQAGNQ